MARRARRSPDEHEQAPARQAPRPTPYDSVLALQRSAGNAAVAQLLRKGPEAPRPGGWNEGGQEVAGTLRIPLTGVKGGNTDEDLSGGTKEGAAGKAIVVVPDGAILDKQPDVLLFFHGMFNQGYRERATKDAARGPAGSVHDVEADRMEQQLAHSGRNIIGILPQGTNAAGFGIADPKQYVDDVLALVAAKLPALKPGMKVPGTIAAGRLIVSGHSGGGLPAQRAAAKLTKTAPADDDAWVKSPVLFLFDGINGWAEADAAGDLAEKWLDADLARLKGVKEPLKLLGRRGIKLRSTHTNTDVYIATNVGGKYQATRRLDELDEKGHHKTEQYTATVTPEKSLKGRIDGWFKRHAADLGGFGPKLREQYDVPDQALGGGHEATVGTGSLETDPAKRDKAPPGLTGASKDAGVPTYGGGGHLEESLSKLPPDAVIPPPPPPHAELEEELEAEEQYA